MIKRLRNRLRKYLHGECNDQYLKVLSELTEQQAIYNYQAFTFEEKIKQLTNLCKDQADRLRAQREELERSYAEEAAAKTIAREFTIELHSKDGVKTGHGQIETNKRKKNK